MPIKNYLYSILIPVYQSESLIEETVRRLKEVIDFHNINSEILLINDGSKDNSWNIIKLLAQKHHNIKSIDLLKNYGQHNALLCGFEFAKGDYLITMDDDLQNPPEEIIKLIKTIQESDYDLVIGKFIEKKHNFFRKIGSKFIGYLNYQIFNKPSNITLTNFRIIKKQLAIRVLAYRNPNPYLPGLLLKFSEKMRNIDVYHDTRKIGKSNYSIFKISKLVSNLLINYSSYPLRVLSIFGVVVSLIILIVGLIFLINGLLNNSRVPGWTSLIVLISFLGSVIILLLALIGEYLSRILSQLSNDKTYIVKNIID